MLSPDFASDHSGSSPDTEDVEDEYEDIPIPTGLEATGDLPMEEEDDERILERCRDRVQNTDFIMEPEVYPTISDYFKAGGGEPGELVDALSDNYKGLAQMCNLMGDWLIQLGSSAKQVEGIFETHLSNLIRKQFHPKTADKIFESDDRDQETKIEWLSDMTHHAPWRSLIFKLAEEYQDCLMLNFSVKLISDAGYQHEISNVNTAAQQLEIFSRVLCTSVDNVLSQVPGTMAFNKGMEELVPVACHSEYTYLYTQSLLHLLAQQEHNTKGGAGAAMKYLSQALRLAAEGEGEGEGSGGARGGQDTTTMTLALSNSSASGSPGCNPALIQAMFSMMSKKTLNPADITLLYNWYSQNDPPPIELIRDPIFIDLLIDSLFGTKGAKLNADHKPKYIYILAYATTVSEYTKKTPRKNLQNKDDMKPAEEAIEKMSELCQGRGDTAATEILAELPTIFQALKLPVVASGVLHWVKCTVTESDYFQLHPEPVPIHLALLDEIATLHHLLHPKVFQLLTFLFNQASSAATEGAGEVLLERQRTFIDRLVHLLSVGYGLAVTEFMALKFHEGSTDTSLVRYFVTETLEIISPPYSGDFVERFLPLVTNKEIVDEDVLDRVSAAQEFIEKSKG